MRNPCAPLLAVLLVAACGQNVSNYVPDAPDPDESDASTPGDACTSRTWYADCDGDGIAALGGETQEACLEPAPAACGGGWTPTQPITGDADCDDTRDDVHPGAAEACDSVDNDCDAAVDEDGLSTFYQDSDGDGFGNPAVNMVTCNAPSDYVSNSMDCNDARPDVHPGAPELCDAVDNDCDLQVDDGVQTTFYRDADGDAYGNLAVTTAACSPPSGYVANSTDCNDGRADIYPGAPEFCDLADNDCDLTVDDGVQIPSWRDNDGDAYGDASVQTMSCTLPAGYVYDNTDCNDARSDVHPWAAEVCDLVDNDCDASVDEGALNTYYQDADGDGYGNPSAPTQACAAPGGYVANASDCNDFSNTTNPGAAEVCFDGADNNCSGAQDEAAECSMSCNWNGARWLSQGYDGGNAAYVGAWVSCQSNKITFMDSVVFNPPGNGPVTPPPSPSGTTDAKVGCNWSGNRWAAQGWDGASALSYGADLTCSGGRVTNMQWENNQLMPTQTAPFTSGQLGCDWTGAIFLSHGIDGNCAWYTGMQVTCHNSHITNVQWMEPAGCARMRD